MGRLNNLNLTNPVKMDDLFKRGKFYIYIVDFLSPCVKGKSKNAFVMFVNVYFSVSKISHYQQGRFPC